MKNIIQEGCPIVAEHGGTSCPAYQTVNQQTYLSLSIVGIVIIIGLFLIFTRPEKEIIFKIKQKKENNKFNTDILKDLKQEEKKVFKIIQEQKAIFQAELIEKTGFGKAKITRILDRLEGKNLVERKRRGMTNVVVLKSSI